MDFDLEKLKQLAGVYGSTTTQTEMDNLNPRKFATLTESLKRSDYDEGLSKIYNWVQVGHIDTNTFKEFIKINQSKIVNEANVMPPDLAEPDWEKYAIIEWEHAREKDVEEALAKYDTEIVGTDNTYGQRAIVYCRTGINDERIQQAIWSVNGGDFAEVREFNSAEREEYRDYLD